MRIVAFASLALALLVAALTVVLLGPGAVAAQGQAMDDIQIEMLNNGQPETVFAPGIKSVSGRVRYNIRDEQGTPIVRSTSISVLDPLGIEVYSSTFTTAASYTGYQAVNFSVTGDQMFSVYRQLSNARVNETLSRANAIPAANTTTGVLSDTLVALSAVGQTASEARSALERLLAFTEIPTMTIQSLRTASQKAGETAQTANTMFQSGACIPGSANFTTCVNQYNQNRSSMQASAQAAKAALDAANAGLQGLTNLSVPSTLECLGDPRVRVVQQTYTSVVRQVIAGGGQGGEPVTRDSWEWQVGDRTSLPAYAIMSAVPTEVYTLDVTVAPTKTAQVNATILGLNCIPVTDGVSVRLQTTIGSLNPMTVTTTSAAGLHGLIQSTFNAGNQPGAARVSTVNLIGSTASVDISVIGPASQSNFSFLSPSGDPTSAPRYIQINADNEKFTVQVRDVNGRPVANGTQVTFAVTNNAGTFVQNTVTTRNGLAEATFRAGSNPGAAQVTATVQGTSVTASLNIVLVGPPNRISLSVAESYTSTIYVNGSSDPSATRPGVTFIEAEVRDAAGNFVADGTEVEFILLSNLGVWDDPLPNSPLSTIARTTGGKARVKLTARPGSDGGQLGVIARVRNTNVQVPPPQALQITVRPESTERTFKLFLPTVYKKALCGRNSPQPGCVVPFSKTDEVDDR